MPATNSLQRTRLSQRYDTRRSGAAHWLIVSVGTLAILGGAAALIAMML